MKVYFVVDNPARWPLRIAGVEVVNARAYLTEPAFTRAGARVFNLCRSYQYQSTGYYVSLLAAARGHRPIPDIGTVRDLQIPSLYRLVSQELDELIQKSLGPLHTDRFTLSIYFGRNLAKRYDRLSLHLFNLFRAPLLRAQFVRQERWELKTIGLIGVSAVPDDHQAFLATSATQFFAKGRRNARRKKAPRFDLALLLNPEDPTPPSNERAIRQFTKAAEELDIGVETIGKDDINRLAEFDGLFIRETTYVTNHTYRFARRAEAEGLVVIDDPASIVRCTNKVYLAELLQRHRVPSPKTVIIHKDNVRDVARCTAMPCILKRPDSSYSAGVEKVEERDAFEDKARGMLQESELIIGQEFIPTPFDWRVGILDGVPLYVCKYFMAGRHWQIVDRDRSGQVREGKVEALNLQGVPKRVVETALRAAALIGNGLYGVDLKETDGKYCVMEINENPSIDAGYEDVAMKSELYRRVMHVFLKRMEAARL